MVLGLQVVPILWVVAKGWQHRWMSDDGFINLRVVRQVVAGNGPVYNAGERIEASTSQLWVFLLAAADVLPGPALPWKAVLLGIALTAVGLAAAQAAGATFCRAVEDRASVPVGALVVVALRPFWDFASSGLESGLGFAWIGGCCWWIARRTTRADVPSPRVELAGGFLVGAGFLVRPDFAIYSLAFGSVLVAASWDRTRRRRRRGVALAVAAPIVVGQLLRMGYYAMLVPNTALAKEAGISQWRMGWRYLGNFVGAYWLWLPVCIVVGLVAWQALGDLRSDARLRAAARLAPIAAGVVHALYIVRIGGDFMHARLLLPALFAIVAPVGVTLPRRPPSLSPALSPAAVRGIVPGLGIAAVAVWAVLCVAGPSSRPAQDTSDSAIVDERALTERAHGPHPVRFDIRVAAEPSRVFLPPRTGQLTVFTSMLEAGRTPLRDDAPVELAAVPVGAGGGSYIMDVDDYAIDASSLGHPVGGHLDGLVGARAGHQKWVPAVWQAAGLSDGSTIDGNLGHVLATEADLAAADAALSCGQLDRYLRDIQEPLTPARFLGNIVDSPSNTHFRVPRSPEAAESQFCD